MANNWERFVTGKIREIHSIFVASPSSNFLDALKNFNFLTEEDYNQFTQEEFDALTICQALHNAQISSKDHLNILVSILIAAGQTPIAQLLKPFDGTFSKQAEPQPSAAASVPLQATLSGLHEQIHRVLVGNNATSGPRDLRIGTQVLDNGTINGNCITDHSVNNYDSLHVGGVGNTVGNHNTVKDSSKNKTSNLDSHNDYRGQGQYGTSSADRDANGFYGNSGDKSNVDGQGNIIGNHNNVTDSSSYKTMNYGSHNKS